ncbi:MAG: aconitase [Hyperthermus sp.]|nr:MAG: aconitase [Hyperthermus sp.]
MYLTRWEERAYNGEYGEALAVAMKLLVSVGEVLGAERLIDVAHVHVSGISYDNIGDAGLEFIESLYTMGGRVRTYSTYNPSGTLLGGQGSDGGGFMEKQLRIINALRGMGFTESATCIPYLVLREPRRGEHLAWGESSAVAVANTLYAARTNREAGPVALAAALAGRTYYWGLHLDENRKPTVVVKYSGTPLDELYAGILGYLVGELYQGEIPYIDAPFTGRRSVISLCAAAAASGNTAMCIVRDYSPEDHGRPGEARDKLALTRRDLEEKREEISHADISDAELFYTGCPHHPKSFLQELYSYIAAKAPHGLKKPMLVSIPGVDARDEAVRKVSRALARLGVHVLPGTCLVVSRFRESYRVVATDSLKAAFYLPRRHGVRVVLSTIGEYVAQVKR